MLRVGIGAATSTTRPLQRSLIGQLAGSVALVPALLGALVMPRITAAQEAPATFEFSFSNPGARSLGLGGAFVALADDATAAFANPAGLVQLLRPEISVEGRLWSFSTPYTAGGRASGEPTGYGIDTVPHIRTATSDEDVSGLSFLSFVYPAKAWSVAVYRHQLAKFPLRTELNGLFAATTGGDTFRELDQLRGTDLDIVSTSVSGAWRLAENLSLGFGIVYFEGRVESAGSAYLVDEYPTTFWELNTFLPERLYSSTSFEADGTDWGVNLGLLWRMAERWRLGGVYRQGPKLPYTIENVAGPAHELPAGTVTDFLSGRTIDFPDTYGLGVSYRSTDGRVTLGFEWDRVEYSSILESLASELVDTTDVVIEDADELHLGVEYVFLQTTPLVAVRVGSWLDPDHRFRFEGDSAVTRALFPSGEDTVHFALGLGLAFESIQVDVGFDYSEEVTTASISAIFSF
jgi:long-subunit fatty acid transport protein